MLRAVRTPNFSSARCALRVATSPDYLRPSDMTAFSWFDFFKLMSQFADELHQHFTFWSDHPPIQPLTVPRT